MIHYYMDYFHICRKKDEKIQYENLTKWPETLNVNHKTNKLIATYPPNYVGTL